MENGFYSLADVFDKALNGVEFKENVELSPEEQAKRDKWLAKQKAKEEAAAAAAAAQAAELKKFKEETAKKNELKVVGNAAHSEDYENHSDYAQVTYDQAIDTLIECRSREAREEGEEQLIQAFRTLVSGLTDPNKCCPDDELTIRPERFIRGFSDRQRFIFSDGMPIRPSFFVQDKNDESGAYCPAWSNITERAVVVEFGCRIPTKRGADGERVPIGDTAKRFMSVQYWHTDTFKIIMTVYERYEFEFEDLRTKLMEFFGKVVSASRKKFDDLKYAINKKAPGVFNKNKTSEPIKKLLNEFLKNGGTSADIQDQSIPANMVVYFNPACKYILVNTSHFRAAVVDPEQAVLDHVGGFAKNADGRVSTYLPKQMALIEIDGGNMTIVRGE